MWRRRARRFLPAAAEAAAAITTLGCTRACFVGSGALRAVADECALKVVELSAGKVTTLAETPLGLRHGPMSSVDGQTYLWRSCRARRGGAATNWICCARLIANDLGRVRAVVTARDGRRCVAAGGLLFVAGLRRRIFPITIVPCSM